MSSFMKAFNPSLREAERVMGEEFEFAGITYGAIAIDDLLSGVQVISGGTLSDVTLTVLISGAVLAASGIKANATFKARGTELRVLTIAGDGSDSFTLNCGPAGVTMPNY
jgi:hypothetical protein